MQLAVALLMEGPVAVKVQQWPPRTDNLEFAGQLFPQAAVVGLEDVLVLVALVAYWAKLVLPVQGSRALAFLLFSPTS